MLQRNDTGDTRVFPTLRPPLEVAAGEVFDYPVLLDLMTPVKAKAKPDPESETEPEATEPEPAGETDPEAEKEAPAAPTAKKNTRAAAR